MLGTFSGLLCFIISTFEFNSDRNSNSPMAMRNRDSQDAAVNMYTVCISALLSNASKGDFEVDEKRYIHGSFSLSHPHTHTHSLTAAADGLSLALIASTSRSVAQLGLYRESAGGEQMSTGTIVPLSIESRAF